MADTLYQLSQLTDFSASHACDAGRFTQELQTSPIVTALDYVSVGPGDPVYVYFRAALSAGDQATLHSLAAAHSGKPLSIPTAVGLYDTTNTPLSSSGGRLFHISTDHAAAEGSLSGSLADVINSYMATAATSTVPVRATAYTEPTGSGVHRSLKSSVTTDTSGSTGAWSVQIKYYDDGMNGPFYETVNLNGTGSVNTVNTNIRFVEWLKCVLVGSDGINDGTITLLDSPSGSGSPIGTIAASDGQTFWSHHYVRPGRTAYLREYMFSATAVSMKIFVRRATPLVPNSYNEIKGTWIRTNAGDSSQQGEYEVPLQFVGPCRMELVVKPDVITAGTVFAAYGFYEV